MNVTTQVKAHRTQMPGQALRGVKNTIAIASGKGGVGKSTVAVNLSIAMARLGAKVGLLDADIYGPSIPTMLSPLAQVEIRDDRYVPVKAHGIQAMSMGYLTTQERALIWRGPMLAKSFIHMINLTDWEDLDYLFIDLPPGTGDIQLSLVQKIPLTGAVIVTTPQQVATKDAQKAINMFETTNIHVIGVIENMSSHICSQCGHHEPIFGHGGGNYLAQNHSCPLLSQIPLDANIGNDCDQGAPTATRDSTDPLTMIFSQTALTIATAIQQLPLNYANKFPPIRVE